jgi:hypothetical protein
MIRTLVFTICPVATLRAVGFKGAALSQFLGHQHTAMHCFIILIKSWVKYNGYVCSIYELKRNCVYTKTSLPLNNCTDSFRFLYAILVTELLSGII